MLMNGPFMNDLGDKETHMMMMEFPHMFEHMMHRYMKHKKSPRGSKDDQPEGEAS